MNKGIDVEIIKDSTNWTGKRLTTFVLKYPRYIHSELMTHRVFSKNSASSRAIPILKMISNIKDDMVQPIWTLNQAGMQGKKMDVEVPIEFDPYNPFSQWQLAFDNTLLSVDALNSLGIHKQNVNRLLEPWMHIKIILTGTDFDNWFELRDHKDAQPEIALLAKKMREAMEESKPQYLNPGEWHIPFGEQMETGTEWLEFKDETKLKISVARCARISYNNVDGSNSTLEKDLELFDKLITSRPLHASPAEHQARVPTPKEIVSGDLDLKYELGLTIGEWEKPYEIYQKVMDGDLKSASLITKRGKYFSNLQGWIQYRKVLEEQFA